MSVLLFAGGTISTKLLLVPVNIKSPLESLVFQDLVNSGLLRSEFTFQDLIIKVAQITQAGMSLIFEVADYTRKIGDHKLKIALYGCCPIVIFKF